MVDAAGGVSSIPNLQAKRADEVRQRKAENKAENKAADDAKEAKRAERTEDKVEISQRARELSQAQAEEAARETRALLEKDEKQSLGADRDFLSQNA
ncbi:MAG: hypothetical protein L6Q57_05425 [Alphaproteobacteria bacterium]|nr:hypothetical protein [Alphaproteobacteria bacterium]